MRATLARHFNGLNNKKIIDLVLTQNFTKNQHFLTPDTQGVRNESRSEKIALALNE